VEKFVVLKNGVSFGLSLTACQLYYANHLRAIVSFDLSLTACAG